MNISATVEQNFPILKETINKALNAGIKIVAAAGNTNAGDVMYPASYNGVISVGAIDKNDMIDKFSSIGKIDNN